MIAKKKPTKRRKVVRPPRPPKQTPRDPMIKILLAPKPSGPPRTKDRTKPKFIKGIGSLMSEGMSKGVATNAMKKAAMELGKGKKAKKPSGLKRPPTMSKEDLEKIKRLLEDKLGNIKRREPVKPKFRKPVAKMPPRRKRAGFMKK